jgi:AcrR family transcriptional regulator
MTLFEAHGFGNVTISQIADAAGVSKMTVTNYFPRKEDLVFDQAEESVRGLADAFAARAPGESLLAAIRRDYAERITAGDVTLGPPTAAFARMVHDSQTLASRLREIADQAEQALADAIAAETGADGTQPQIVAAQLAAIHRVLFADSAKRVLAGQPRDEIKPSLTESARRAFDLLEPSLGNYCVRP